MLGALLDSSWNVSRSNGGGGVAEYFIDRNPACFAVLLDLLCTGSLHVPPHLPKKLPYREALYYGLLDHVRVAQWVRSTGTASTSRPLCLGAPPGTARPSAPCPTAGATSCTAARCTCQTRCSTSAARSRSTTRRSTTSPTLMRACS
jgi:hypothetical protein